MVRPVSPRVLPAPHTTRQRNTVSEPFARDYFRFHPRPEGKIPPLIALVNPMTSEPLYTHWGFIEPMTLIEHLCAPRAISWSGPASKAKPAVIDVPTPPGGEPVKLSSQEELDMAAAIAASMAQLSPPPAPEPAGENLIKKVRDAYGDREALGAGAVRFKLQGERGSAVLKLTEAHKVGHVFEAAMKDADAEADSGDGWQIAAQAGGRVFNASRIEDLEHSAAVMRGAAWLVTRVPK